MRLLFWCVLFCQLAVAAVVRVEITSKANVADGTYERIAGKVYFAVNPALAQNQIVRDIDLAPKNAQGDVEFSADFCEIRPHQGGNGTALFEVSNRGGKALTSEFNFAHGRDDIGDGFLLKQGFTLVWVGWEFDLPPNPVLLHAYLPIATEHGKPISGMVRSEWVGETRQETIALGDKGQIGYAALEPASTKDALFVRDAVAAPRTLIPRTQWRFADNTHATLDGGFAPGRIYEVVYEAKDPVIAGLGLAAVRDFASYLKHGDSDRQGPGVKRALAFGVSQSGRFLREFLYDGFNEDEVHRQVFDGVWAHVAGAGRGSFNHRFSQPSRDGHAFTNVFYPVDVPPFDEESLLAKAQRAHVLPKLIFTNGSYEYWGRGASLIHTTSDGKADAPPSQRTRIYFFSGSQHTVGAIPPQRVHAQNLSNTNDYRYGLRAVLLAMQNWLWDKSEPPPSQFPRLAQGQLTTLAKLRFPSLPGIVLPAHKREAYALDFSIEPPTAAKAFPSFVPQVDPDGNDLGGIKMPEIAVPLAAYTGWNLRDEASGSPREMLPFVGSWIPFTRQSIDKRYANENTYLDRIDGAARKLVKDGFVLEADLPLLHERAVREWDYRSSLP